MIVTCTKCQTRFKIPDEKVTEKGVKVRCTKCGNTFRVTREMGEPTGQFSSGGPPPPRPSGPDPFERFGKAPEPPASEATRPGVFTLGVEATRMPDFRLPPRRSGAKESSKPVEAPKPAPPEKTFDFSSLVPPVAPAVPPAPAPFDFAAISAPPPAAPGGFDFASLAAPPPPAAAGSPGAFDFSALPPASVPVPPPMPVAPARPPAPPATSTPAFDFSGLSAPPPPPPPRAPARPGPPPASSTPAFDFSGMAAPPAGPSLGAWPPNAPSPTLAPPQQPPPADDFFASLPPAPAPSTVSRQLLDLPDDASPDDAKQALFDMRQPEPSTVKTEQVPALALPPSSSQSPVPIVARPVTEPELPRRKRTALGVVVNVGIAAVLMGALVVVGSAFLNEGKLTREALSLEALKNTFAPSAKFIATDISNGLYETKSGRAVFFVRGEVTNRTALSARVNLQADIVEGSSVVRSGKGVSGAVPTPEELFALGSSDDLEKLATRLAPRAMVVEPGGSAPFLIVFYEYPHDLKGFRVRVLAAADAQATAQRP